jgi:hypothetical protein
MKSSSQALTNLAEVTFYFEFQRKIAHVTACYSLFGDTGCQLIFSLINATTDHAHDALHRK